MSRSAERVSSSGPGPRRRSILRRVTAAVALSTAAAAGGLAALPPTAADASVTATDDHHSTVDLSRAGIHDWGAVTAPEHFVGTVAHTVSTGS